MLTIGQAEAIGERCPGRLPPDGVLAMPQISGPKAVLAGSASAILCCLFHCKRHQAGGGGVEGMIVVTIGARAEQTHRGVPGTIFPVEQPEPVRCGIEQHPNGFGQRPHTCGVQDRIERSGDIDRRQSSAFEPEYRGRAIHREWCGERDDGFR